MVLAVQSAFPVESEWMNTTVASSPTALPSATTHSPKYAMLKDGFTALTSDDPSSHPKRLAVLTSGPTS